MWKGFLRKRTRVLFSHREHWQEAILQSIDQNTYAPYFADIRAADLNHYDLIVPLKLEDIAYLNDTHPELNGEKYLVPTTAVLDICNDKAQFNQFLSEHGHGQFIPEAGNEYPYILKKRIDAWGRNSIIIPDSETEDQHADKARSRDYFRQAYIEGRTEYATHILFRNGAVRFHRTVEFDFDTDYYVYGKRDQSAAKRSLAFTPFIDTFGAILTDLNYEGICCFDYKIQDSQPRIFELNPRYGSSLTGHLGKLMPAYSALLGALSTPAAAG